ncbi:MAG: anaerobic C4-dicarboxylate transporter [Burkholderiaceae bacterium]
MVSFVAIFAAAGSTINGQAVTLVDVMSLTIPSTLLAILVVCAFSWFRGKDLDKDPEFQARIADPEVRAYVYGDTATLIGKKLPGNQWAAMWIFIAAVAFIGVLGSFAELRPVFKGKSLNMVLVIQMVMLCAGALMVIFCKTDAAKIGKNEVFRSGMIAIVAVFGIAWMADTVFEAHMPMLKATLVDVVKDYPWMYAIVLVLVSKFVNSQAASVAAIVPVALAIGLDPGYVLAFAAACYGYYILPTYPSDLAAIQFDRSGTTGIGKYVINHSFIIPGLLGVSSSCVIGYILATIYGYV